MLKRRSPSRRPGRGIVPAVSAALGWASALSLVISSAAAQQGSPPATSDTPAASDTLFNMRNLPSVLPLTVRPRTMATGTRNPAAGVYALRSVVRHRHHTDSTANWKYPVPWPTQIRDAWSLGPRDTSYDPTALVSVAPQCVGARRCPLLLALPGGGLAAQVTTDWLHPATDKYGIILLALTENHYSLAETDAALKETLQRFAIDPERIAILGRCASGVWGTRYGIDNPEIFSRIAIISGGLNLARVEQLSRNVEFLIDNGINEWVSKEVDQLRAAGFTVRETATIRTHGHQAEDYDLLGRWLQESWTKTPAERPRPAVIEPPLLTTDAIARLTTFWTRFSQEPDAIRNGGRRAYIRDVLVSLGRPPASGTPAAPQAERQVIVPMSDMAALAAKYPPVAADLKKAGLTGRQHDAYRIALISAMFAQLGSGYVFDSTSDQAKNAAFVETYADELQQLADAGVVNRDQAKESEWMGIFLPSDIGRAGPLGIWRTP